MGTFSVLLEERAGCVWIILNRPDRHNALNVGAWEELGRIIETVQDRTDLHAVVVTGNGASFSSGLDLEELGAVPVDRAERTLRVVEETLLRIESLPVPTVAAIHGWTLGSGAELAMACDLRIAADDLRFGLPVARLGIMISSQLLERVVDMIGHGLTKELLFTGRHLSAEEAASTGLLNRLVPKPELEGAVQNVLEAISQSSPGAVRKAKRMMMLCQPITMAHRLPPSAPYYLDPADFAEGIRARVEGRRPRFQVGLQSKDAAGRGGDRFVERTWKHE